MIFKVLEPKRVDSDHPDFGELVEMLDRELALRDGDDHGFYAQFNKIDVLKHAVVVYGSDRAVGCGAIKPFDESSVEVKRMFVRPTNRNQGAGAIILAELERWAKELGYSYTVLETGLKQPEAIRLYEKSGYKRIPNYGQYEGVENSVCMKKMLD